MLGREIDQTASFRHPQLDAVVLEQRRHQRVLATVERPLVLPDHDRVPAPIRGRQSGDQSCGLRAPRPRQHPALPGVEEFRHYRAVPGGQHDRLLQLPRPRRLRVLPVLGRHPPVKREPQAPPGLRRCLVAARALCPRRQHVSARIAARPTRRQSRHLPLPPHLTRPDHSSQLPLRSALKHQAQRARAVGHHLCRSRTGGFPRGRGRARTSDS
jgi:hypothetical protein